MRLLLFLTNNTATDSSAAKLLFASWLVFFWHDGGKRADSAFPRHVWARDVLIWSFTVITATQGLFKLTERGYTVWLHLPRASVIQQLSRFNTDHCWYPAERPFSLFSLVLLSQEPTVDMVCYMYNKLYFLAAEPKRIKNVERKKLIIFFISI